MLSEILKKIENALLAFFNAMRMASTQFLQLIVNHKLISFTIFLGCASFVFLFSFFTPNEKKIKQEITILPEKPIKPLIDNFIPPEEPRQKQGYSFHFEPKTHWDEQDAKKWFVTPNSEMVEELKSVNGTIINNILGEVP
ncbi:MAG: hypothetical protein ACRC5H_06905 [Treponemataceae bacterium]